MKCEKTILLFACLFPSINTTAQLSTNELPVSYGVKLNSSNNTKSVVRTIIMPQLDMAKIEAEDKEDEEYDMPPRFGYRHKVNYDTTNSGTWTVLPNGGKIWQLNVICPDALSVNFCYDKFWIPEGGKFFIYSKDKKYSIGAFTSKNNKGDSANVRGFATGLVFGNDIILEYYQPKEVSANAIISIDYIVHGYRYIRFDEKSSNEEETCMVNVNCDEGQNWQNEKKAVARFVVEGNRYCSGSLITTTDLSEEPYYLTANHCISPFNKDAAGDSLLEYSFFCWNYETPGCANVNYNPYFYFTSGATVLANYYLSDYALLRLDEDPKDLSSYIPYYLGWDNSGNIGNPGVCIHHPNGGVKKISTVKDPPISSHNYYHTGSYQETHWKVYWKATTHGHGTTDLGSSGSPLLTAAHKVIGQLQSGSSSCYYLNGNDKYGKFDLSWTGNNNDSICRRLNCWIDSINAGVQTMEGLMIIPSGITMNTDEQLYSNIRVKSNGQLTIKSNVELMGNSRVIVESGGKLIIDGGNLSNVNLILKAGSTLEIINGGIIETQNGFEAPMGAIVYISHGKIL